MSSGAPIPRVDGERAKACLLAIERAIGESNVDTTESALVTYARDESEAPGVAPDGVVHVQSAQDIARVLELAAKHEVPVTPRAGGTGRSGGAIPSAGGIVMATAAMNRIVEIDKRDLTCVVQPGAILADLHAAVEAEGLFYPPDPNSLANCMIGGNLAENAGGPRAFKYGVTGNYVLGLTAHLMGGVTMPVGRRTVKGVTGYDVTSLLVGSEGTLAVFSEVRLRLVTKPEDVGTLMGLFSTAEAAARAVETLLIEGFVPRCMELMDAPTLACIRGAGVAVDPRAGAMLLMEVDGDARDVESARDRLGERLSSCEGVLDVLVAQNASMRSRLWEARRALSPATRRLAKYKISEDVVVPRSRISALLAEVDRMGVEHRVRHLTYGHAGDGNLHVNFLWNDDSEAPAIQRAVADLMRTTVGLGGTLSGEHGIGLTKSPYIALEQGPDLVLLQMRLKDAFDPKRLLNPGKIFENSSHRAC